MVIAIRHSLRLFKFANISNNFCYSDMSPPYVDEGGYYGGLYRYDPWSNYWNDSTTMLVFCAPRVYAGTNFSFGIPKSRENIFFLSQSFCKLVLSSLNVKDSELMSWAGNEGCPVCGPGSAIDIKGHKSLVLNMDKPAVKKIFV
jgi:hypothetical protein